MSEPTAQLRALRERVHTNEVRLESLQSDVDEIDARVSRIELVLAHLLKEMADERDTTVNDLAGEEDTTVLEEVSELGMAIAGDKASDTDSTTTEGCEDEFTRHL